MAFRGAHARGHRRIGDAVEYLLRCVDEETEAKAELVALAEDVILTGTHEMREALIYFAFGDTWATPSARRFRDIVAVASLDEKTIDEIPRAVAGPHEVGSEVRSFPEEKWEMMLAYRQRYGEERSDLRFMRKFYFRSHDHNDPLANRLVEFWRSQPPEQRTPPVRKLIRALEEGVERSTAWLAALPKIANEDTH
jgi:hypothetical protein